MASEPTRSGINSGQRRALGLAIACLLIAGLYWKAARSASKPPPVSEPEARLPQPNNPVFRPLVHAPSMGNDATSANPHAPKPMKLEARVLVRSEWNSGTNAFGLDKPPGGQEGATVGPASVAYADGNVYVLDNVNKRVLRYDSSGNLLASIKLPGKGATDITTDARGSVLVIDHYNDRIYSITGNTAVLLGPLPMKDDFPIGTKFAYDTASNSLTAQDVDRDGLARVDGNNLVLPLADGKEMSIPFPAPVACVEEVITDPKGILWVLYTLEGDYRMRRLARVDPVTGSVGVAELDVWFAFDATRHMAPADNGVVVFAGDEREGRLVSFAWQNQ